MTDSGQPFSIETYKPYVWIQTLERFRGLEKVEDSVCTFPNLGINQGPFTVF